VRYKIQFTADEAYVALLERARDLLQHRVPDRDLGKVQAWAMAALVEQVERQKCGGPSRSAPVAAGPEAEPGSEEPPGAPSVTQEALGTAPATRTAEPQCSQSERPEPPATCRQCCAAASANATGAAARLRDSRGVRCRETGGLEYHHRHPFALGGVTSVDNCALRSSRCSLDDRVNHSGPEATMVTGGALCPLGGASLGSRVMEASPRLPRRLEGGS
jgi:hypothetical protein